MNSYHPHELRRRALGGYAAIAVLLGVLLIGFFRIQVLLGEEHRLRAASNRVRTLPVPAPRGTIYDREGRILADNVPGYQVTILPGPVDEVRATLGKYLRICRSLLFY